MQEIIKDSAIKLFGKKIPFDLEVAWTMSDDDEDVMKETEDDADETEQHQGPSPEDVHESDPESGNPKTPSIDEETAKPKDSDKMTLKKPDKILPCPRCKSMDTKFCYYNNYNVNQPRHFCKSCQRYWTSGGTMRNVPVGAGRRKSKSSSAAVAAAAAGYPQQICISAESLHHPHHQYPNSRRNHHGTVLSFSSDSRTQGPGLPAMNRNVDDSSSESTVTTTTSNTRNEELLSHPNNLNGYGVHPPPPWPYNMAAVPFYPFWTCHVPATPWNLPWPPPPAYPCSEKRFREGDDDSEREPKKVLAPKTLRMDDPNDAAKSSIWATLGINKEGGVAPKGGFFKGFQKTHIAVAGELQGGENPSLLQCANPAAFSRSLNFHERH